MTPEAMIPYLLVVSLIANLLVLAYAAQVIRGRGGLSYLRSLLFRRPPSGMDLGVIARQSHFDLLPASAIAPPIVFVGDSLTAGCEWREMFGGEALILNRGIGGDTSGGVSRRAESVAALKPLAVFLMIGTNDPQSGFSTEDTVRNDRQFIETIRRLSPHTKLYLESILPTQSPKFNAWSEQANQGVRSLADDESVFYLDFRQAFFENGALSVRLTEDGIHLNGAGYLCWKQQIDPVVQHWIEIQRDRGAAARKE